MRAIDLADMLEEQYKNKHVQCNMTIATCGNKPCDLCRIEQFEREIRADERAKVLEELINAIDEDNYCLQEECPYYRNCGTDSCPIDSKSEVIIQTWLKKIKEQK